MINQRLMSLALGSALAAGSLPASGNPFAWSPLPTGYGLVQAHETPQGDRNATPEKPDDKKKEGKCAVIC